MGDFDELVQELVEVRLSIEGIKDAIQNVANDISETKLGKLRESLEASYSGARRAETTLIGTIKEAAVEQFNETGNKKPHPAVGIREQTILTYSQKRALEYAIEHKLSGTLKLDKRKFEAAAKALGLNFVTVRKVPKGTIARDLEPYR